MLKQSNHTITIIILLLLRTANDLYMSDLPEDQSYGFHVRVTLNHQYNLRMKKLNGSRVVHTMPQSKEDEITCAR